MRANGKILWVNNRTELKMGTFSPSMHNMKVSEYFFTKDQSLRFGARLACVKFTALKISVEIKVFLAVHMLEILLQGSGAGKKVSFLKIENDKK